jgi:WD40 repeat protein
MASLLGHTTRVTIIATEPSVCRIVTGDADGEIRVWDMNRLHAVWHVQVGNIFRNGGGDPLFDMPPSFSCIRPLPRPYIITAIHIVPITGEIIVGVGCLLIIFNASGFILYRDILFDDEIDSEKGEISNGVYGNGFNDGEQCSITAVVSVSKSARDYCSMVITGHANGMVYLWKFMRKERVIGFSDDQLEGVVKSLEKYGEEGGVGNELELKNELSELERHLKLILSHSSVVFYPELVYIAKTECAFDGKY